MVLTTPSSTQVYATSLSQLSMPEAVPYSTVLSNAAQAMVSVVTVPTGARVSSKVMVCVQLVVF